MISRRSFFLTGSLVAIKAAAPARLFGAESKLFGAESGLFGAEPGRRFAGLSAALAQLERESNGRLGVAVLDTGSGDGAGYRSDERFAMCSTFKTLLAAAVLRRVDAGTESLDRTLPMPAQFLFNSPLTQPHAGGSMTIRDLCAACLTRSDNTATNLLLATIDGPAGITRFARSLDDTVTRLDRVETALNQALPNDPRDTTSPAAMAADWRRLLLGEVLSPPSRKQLTAWLVANRTGMDRLRAGFPATWVVGDKTGSNGENTSNDVAIVWSAQISPSNVPANLSPTDLPPTGKAPILVAAYLTECVGSESKRNAVLAEVGLLVARSIPPA